MKKLVLTTSILLCMTMLFGCSSGEETSAQSRTDLTAEHIRGLSADMKRKDVEDLIGQDDDNLASKEDIDVYGLSDGSTAVLRYVDDTLTGVYVRGKDMYEETIFSKFAKELKEDITGESNDTNDSNYDDSNYNDGNYDTNDGNVNGETNVGESQPGDLNGETGALDLIPGTTETNTGDTTSSTETTR